MVYSSLQQIVISRRSLLRDAALVLGAPLLNRGRFSLFAQGEGEYCARTVDLVRESTVIDMLPGLKGLNLVRTGIANARDHVIEVDGFLPPPPARIGGERKSLALRQLQVG